MQVGRLRTRVWETEDVGFQGRQRHSGLSANSSRVASRSTPPRNNTQKKRHTYKAGTPCGEDRRDSGVGKSKVGQAMEFHIPIRRM